MFIRFFVNAAALAVALPAIASDSRTDPAPSVSTKITPLETGSVVAVSALQAARWSQGEAPKEWERNKVYVFECWATWCGPCIAQIPHMNALHQKYAAKGLRVYGMDVWEDGESKVAAFVKRMGEKMSYPVAYVGKTGAFDKEWLQPAGVTGIPFGFVVKNGRVLALTNPALLTDEVIEGFLSTDEARVIQAQKTVTGETDRNARYWAAEGLFRDANQKGDVTGMEKQAALMEEAASEPAVGQRLCIAIRKAEWETASALLGKLPSDDTFKAMALRQAVETLPADGTPPAKFTGRLIELSEPVFKKWAGPVDFEKIARLWWARNDRPKAIAAMDTAARMAAAPAMKAYGFEPEPYLSKKERMEKGEMPAE